MRLVVIGLICAGLFCCWRSSVAPEADFSNIKLVIFLLIDMIIDRHFENDGQFLYPIQFQNLSSLQNQLSTL